MIKYQYQVLRYMHDQFTGEFVNVGVVLYAPEVNFLQARIITRYGRISRFFGGIEGHFLIASLKRFEAVVAELSENLEKITDAKKRIDAITSTILVKDDSALQLSNEIFSGIDIDADIALADIYERLVEKYDPDEHEKKQNDQYVWSSVYKRYFDQQGITRQLKKHSFTTEKDTIEFERSWKNGVWNCYQPLNLDLSAEDSIKNKVYKWYGIIKQLETAQEPANVFFLTSSPKRHNELKTFVEEMLESSSEQNIRVEVIEEKEADAFVAAVREQMVASGKIDEKDEDPF